MKTATQPANNAELAHELKNKVSEWVNTFNFIQVDVLKLVAESENSDLMEHIRQPKLTWEGLADFEGCVGNKKWIKEQQKKCGGELENHPSYDSYREQQEQDNYPMWNTCFEFKEKESDEVIEAAINAGFGVIEGLGGFNQILFVSGAGYSFYGAHWIPLYLALPWNESERKKYAGVDYSGQ